MTGAQEVVSKSDERAVAAWWATHNAALTGLLSNSTEERGIVSVVDMAIGIANSAHGRAPVRSINDAVARERVRCAKLASAETGMDFMSLFDASD